MSAVVELDDVAVHIGKACILDRISLRVREGERVAIVGPNGAGKSTLVDVLLGVRRPSRGLVRVLARTPPCPDVGFIPQDPGASLLPWLDVRENVALPLRIRRLRDRTRAVDEIARAVDPERTIALDARPSTLSGGQRQRVALMRALAGDPPLVVCDEPFSAIDEASRLHLRSLLAARCPTLVFVTHDRDDVRDLATRVVHLASGGALT